MAVPSWFPTKLFISANAYSGTKDTVFAIVRYGNVSGSRGSIIPYFRSIVEKGQDRLPITDYRMTRFWITMQEGIDLVLKALAQSKGGEIYISKIPSFKVVDLAKAICPHCVMPEVGIREGEKLHEIMITKEDAISTHEYERHYIIYPHMDWCDLSKFDTQGSQKVADGFEYRSDTNAQWLSVEALKELLAAL